MWYLGPQWDGCCVSVVVKCGRGCWVANHLCSATVMSVLLTPTLLHYAPFISRLPLLLVSQSYSLCTYTCLIFPLSTPSSSQVSLRLSILLCCHQTSRPYTHAV